MHQSAHSWLANICRQLPLRRSILELGSKDVNGSPRALFPQADRYLGVDLVAGAGVDVVADAATFQTEERFDTCICMEVLEHTDRAREVCRTIHQHLHRGGVALITAAGVGREPHSAVDGGALREGEFYRNVTVSDLRWWLSDFPLVMVDAGTAGDVYAIAVKW